MFETQGCSAIKTERFWKCWLRNLTYFIQFCGFGGVGALACAIFFGQYGMSNPDLIANS
jgi:hypothetical protein